MKRLIRKYIVLNGLFLVVLTWAGIEAYAQPPDTLWTRTYGGDDDDFGECVQQTTDGGYIITGFTYSYGHQGEVYLIKTDAEGNSLWTQTYGGDYEDEAFSVQQTTDGGYVIVGRTEPLGAWSDVYLIKTDELGDTLWTRTYGGNNEDHGYCVRQTADGGYVITGTDSMGTCQYEDVYLIKTDAAGNEQWQKTIGGNGTDHGESIQQTTDGGYVICGSSTVSLLSAQLYLIKTNEIGDTLWTRTYGGSGVDRGYSVQQTDDGGYIATGYTYSYGAGESDVYLVKTDGTGNEQWQRTFGGSNHDRAYSVQQTDDGGYIVAGYTHSFGAGDFDVYLVKTDGAGNEQWQLTIGGSMWELGKCVQQTSEGGYVIAGRTFSYAYGENVYLIKLAGDTPVKDSPQLQPMSYRLHPAYPNPFNPTTVISFDLPVAGWVTLEVFDVSGQNVGAVREPPLQYVWLSAGNHQITFDGTGLASGVYIYSLTNTPVSGSGATPTTMIGKMVLLK